MTLTRTVRRWLAALGIAALVTAAGTAPAGAAAAGDDLALYANNAVLTPGGTLRTISVYPLTDRPLPSSTLTVDRGEVDAFALVEPPPGTKSCTESGAVIRCTVQGGADSALLHLSVSARDGATAGQEGRLTLTLSTPDAGTATARPTITVGEGVALVAAAELPLSGRPGARLPAPLAVTNRGATPARGAVLLVQGPYPLLPDRRYQNCQYAERPIPDLGATVFACSFPDAVLEPGATARPDDSFALRFRRDAWAPDDLRGNAFWFTPADWQEFLSIARLGDRLGPWGTQGTLRLTTRAGVASAPPQTDVDPYDNGTALFLHVTGDQRADLAADGATVTGVVGATVPLTVGWTNNGPAATTVDGSQQLWTLARVRVPEGAVAVSAPRSCQDVRQIREDDPGPEIPEYGWGVPGAREYECHATENIPPGGQLRLRFELRITRAASTGRIELRHYRGDERRPDLNPANDSAIIRVAPPASGGAGGGGTLPITGDRTALTAGLGALLLATGAAGYLLARRRNTRFLA
ncbi:LPXTG cell wall anchor domain-containing protein [Micromonospora sp. NPDC049836]|uniref:LPXTG cell wall anchor domain-containing protein n=1 Tax=Micromonospora sp. NPDC049836 TaxID=3364274 RepID=UPI0037B46526